MMDERSIHISEILDTACHSFFVLIDKWIAYLSEVNLTTILDSKLDFSMSETRPWIDDSAFNCT